MSVCVCVYVAGVLIAGVILITRMCELSQDTLQHFKKVSLGLRAAGLDHPSDALKLTTPVTGAVLLW